MRILVRAATVAALAGIASVAFSKVVHVDIAVTDGGSAKGVVVSFAPISSAAPPPTTVTIDAHGSASVDLPSGVWNVHAESKQFWAEDRTVDTQAADDRIHLTLVPAGTLTGSVAPANPTVKEIGITLTGTKAKSVVELRCPVRDGAFRCHGPAGHFDIRVQARPYSPVYVWDAQIAPNVERSIGVIPLREGGSVVGWVESPDHTPSSSATAHLAPAGADDSGKLTAMGASAATNKRGFFQISGIPAGVYTLTVTSPGMAAATVSPLEIRTGLEAHLRDPITLSHPVTLTLHLDPPLDPYHHPWDVSLARGAGSLPASGGRWAHAASAEGTWREQSLPAGQYLLIVSGSEDSRWFKDEFRLDTTSERTIKLTAINVDGTLTDQGKPLSARIWFGGHSGNRRARVEADGEGHFEGVLPQEGTWIVEVERRDGTTIALGPVEVHVPPGKDKATVDLKLPSTEISGTVVQSSGALVPNAAVQILTPAQRIVTQTDAAGRFIVTGLPSGEVTVQAEKDGQSSAATTLSITEAQPAAGLRLVLDDPLQIRGRVTGRGLPIPAARVALWPSTGLIQMATTDLEGRFNVTLPPGAGTVNVLVVAPGYALHVGQRFVDPKQSLDISLGDVGAKLLFVMQSREDLGRAFVQHDQANVPLGLLVAMTNASIEAAAHPRTAIDAEPGTYALCIPANQICKSGTLLPGNQLMLDLTASP